MLFDKAHLIFMLVSSLVIIGLLIVCGRFIKVQKYRDLVLKIAALLTVIIHYSRLYVDYFTTGSAEIGSNMILPVYPCNIAMWLLLIVAFYKNKQSKVFKVLAEITFYLGIVGGIAGIVLNEIYASNPNLADWSVLNGLLSHCTMLFGCIYLLVGKYIRIRVDNMISVVIGLLLLFVDGWLIIGLYKMFALDPPNSMYLLSPPVEALPWFNTYLIGLIAIVVFFTITSIYEWIAVPKEERWYRKIKKERK
ncbi:MAG: YwaF family protein [Clostridia bacterium]|nr:YwaF family protein [Clostridia bacterium]